MAIISDGTTSVDLGLCAELIDPILEKSSKRTAGGNTRSITSGERLVFSVKGRVTPTILRSAFDLLKNGASNYFYTPNDASEWEDLYDSSNFPLNCNITGLKREWDNRNYYYIMFNVESVSYV